MKIALTIVLLSLCGCAHFSTTQTDLNYVDGKPTRKITTHATATTFGTSKSELAKFKASQTDKSQSATVGSLDQASSGTNIAANINALTGLLNAIKTP